MRSRCGSQTIPIYHLLLAAQQLFHHSHTNRTLRLHHEVPLWITYMPTVEAWLMVQPVDGSEADSLIWVLCDAAGFMYDPSAGLMITDAATSKWPTLWPNIFRKKTSIRYRWKNSKPYMPYAQRQTFCLVDQCAVFGDVFIGSAAVEEYFGGVLLVAVAGQNRSELRFVLVE